jgi:hypothetical protein
MTGSHCPCDPRPEPTTPPASTPPLVGLGRAPLAVANAELGSLDGVTIVALSVFVSGTTSFTQQHLAANGASDVLIEVLGERGRHARTAVATPVLPLDSPVEVQLVVGIDQPEIRAT